MKKLVLWILAFFVLSFSFANASKEKVEACTLEYAPVCWVDGKTYGNKCAAWKVKIVHNWECKEEDYMTLACPAIYMPVVWTDWKTYSNECMAKAAWAFDNNIKMNNEKLLNSYLDFEISLPMPIKDEKEFLKKYWKVCVSATDWVNTHFIKNWEIVWSTRVWIPANFKPVYTCLAFEGLVLDQDLKSNFENSLKKLSLQEIKKINSALKNFYKDTKDFEWNLAKTQKLVKRIDRIKEISKFKTEYPILVLDYIKYQVIELFTQK